MNNSANNNLETKINALDQLDIYRENKKYYSLKEREAILNKMLKNINTER